MLLQSPPDESSVGASSGLIEELSSQMRFDLRTLSYDEQTARILVDAVH